MTSNRRQMDTARVDAHCSGSCTSDRTLSMRPVRCLLLSIGIALGTQVSAAEPAPIYAVVVNIEGVEEMQLASVRSSLAIIAYETRKTISEARLNRLIAQIPHEASAALHPFGYYNANATATLSSADSKPRVITVDVDPGTPVLVRNIEVGIVGAAARNERIANLREALEDDFLAKVKAAIEDYPIFMAIAENIGYDAAGRRTDVNELETVARELARFVEHIERGDTRPFA